MKNKTASLIVFFFALSIFHISAQNQLSESEQKAFKAKVQSTAESTKSIVSDFDQVKHLSILDNAILSEGKLVFKAPDLVKWEYTKPYQNIAIFNNDKLYVTNNGKKDDIDLSSNKMFRSLNSLIVSSIKGNMFDDSQFDLTYFKTNAGYLVKFIPKDKRLKKFIAAFEINFTPQSAEVTDVKLIEPNDDYTLITFKNKQLNAAVSDSVFKN